MTENNEIKHLSKYQQALLRTLRAITGKDYPADPEFEALRNYSYGWHAIGALAIAVWELELFHSENFDQHPEWDAAAAATFQYLVDHCSRCGLKQQSLEEVVLCPECRQTVTDEYFHRVMEGPVAQEVTAFARDLADSFEEAAGEALSDLDSQSLN